PRVRTHTNDSFERAIRQSQTGRCVIETEKIQIVMGGGELAVSEEKVGIPLDGLIEQVNGLTQFFVDLGIERNRRDERFRADVKTIGDKIFSRALVDSGFLFRRNDGLKL